MNQKNAWESLPLESLTEFIKDGTHGTHQDVDRGIPLLSAKDIGNGFLKVPDDCRRISDIDYQLIHKNYTIARNDILLTVVGSIGRCCLISNSEPQFTIQRSVAIIRSKNIDPRYLYHYFSSEPFQKNLRDLTNASAQGGVYLGSLAKCFVYFPISEEEQTQIAAVLSTIDLAITQTEAIIAKQQRIKTGLMQDLLTKGIDENGNIRSEATHEFKDSSIGRIPVEWESSKLLQAFSLAPRNGIYKPANLIGKGTILIGQNSFTEDRLIDYKMTRRAVTTENDLLVYNLQEEDILISRVYATVDGVGLPAFVSDLPEKAVYESNMLRIRIDKSVILPKLLFYWLQSVQARKYIFTSVNASNQTSINQKLLNNLPILIPPPKEQERLLEILETNICFLMGQKTLHNKQFSIKTGLMQDLLTGKVRVTPLLEQEPASR
jgi:type I restriction enzyme, S subunit